MLISGTTELGKQISCHFQRPLFRTSVENPVSQTRVDITIFEPEANSHKGAPKELLRGLLHYICT